MNFSAALIALPSAVLSWQPQRDEAQRLIDEELSHPRYQQAQPNPAAEWLGQRWQDLMRWLDGLGQGAAQLPAWLLPALLVVGAVVLLILVRPGANVRGRRRPDPVLSERISTPDDHRAAAQAAFDRGDHGQALLSWLRAAVRDAEVRTVLDERPGRTASEAARELARLAPDETRLLAEVAQRFNAVLYDHATATPEQALAARDLDARLAATPAPSPARILEVAR